MDSALTATGLDRFLTDWSPGPTNTEDILSGLRLQQLAATLDIGEQFADGDPVPPLWHWVFFLRLAPPPPNWALTATPATVISYPRFRTGAGCSRAVASPCGNRCEWATLRSANPGSLLQRSSGDAAANCSSSRCGTCTGTTARCVWSKNKIGCTAATLVPPHRSSAPTSRCRP